MPKSVSDQGPETARGLLGEQSAGATKEVLLSQRGISDISITTVTETLHTAFFIEKEGCFRDQTLTYKNNIPIHWERSSTAKITGDVLMGQTHFPSA